MKPTTARENIMTKILEPRSKITETEKATIISISIPQWLVQELIAYAEDGDYSRSSVVGAALSAYLAEKTEVS